MTEDEFLGRLRMVKWSGWTVQGSLIRNCSGHCPIESVAKHAGFIPGYKYGFPYSAAKFLVLEDDLANLIMCGADSKNLHRSIPMRQKILSALDLKEPNHATD